MSSIALRPAKTSDLTALSALCIASKAVWGYDEAFMEACREELTVRPTDLPGTVVATRDADIVGMARIVFEGTVADLEKLYVHPTAIGAGVGRMLFNRCRDEALTRGAEKMTIEADPNAASFYERMGAVMTSTVPSGSIPGRFLPLLTLRLSEPVHS